MAKENFLYVFIYTRKKSLEFTNFDLFSKLTTIFNLCDNVI